MHTYFRKALSAGAVCLLFLYSFGCKHAAENADEGIFLLKQGSTHQARLDTAIRDRLALTVKDIAQPEQLEVYLLQDNGRITQPEFGKQEGEAYTWYFSPINNPCLYHLIGKEGQQPDSFTFVVAQGKDVVDSLSFRLNPQFKRSILKEKETHHIHVYLPEQSFQQGFHAEANHYLEQLGLPSGSVHWTEQELLFAGLNIRYAVYEQHDTLRLHYQLTNRSDTALFITAQPFRFTNVRLQAIEPASAEGKRLPKGARMAGEQAWIAQAWPGELFMLAEGIRLLQPDTLLIGLPLHLMRKSEKELPCR